MYNEEFVDNFEKNEEFIYIDKDEEYVDVQKDNNVEGKNLYENVDGNDVPCMNQLFQILDDAGKFFRVYALKSGFSTKIQLNQMRVKKNGIYARTYVCRISGKCVVG